MDNLPQIKSIVETAIEENQSIKDLKSDVSVLKADVAELKTDVAELKTDVAELKTTVHKHGQKLDRLDEKVHHQGIMFESMQRDLKLILDAVIPLKERALQADKIESLVNSHDHRLDAIEITLKTHLHDHA